MLTSPKLHPEPPCRSRALIDEDGVGWICTSWLRRYFYFPQRPARLWLTLSLHPAPDRLAVQLNWRSDTEKGRMQILAKAEHSWRWRVVYLAAERAMIRFLDDKMPGWRDRQPVTVHLGLITSD